MKGRSGKGVRKKGWGTGLGKKKPTLAEMAVLGGEVAPDCRKRGP